MTVSQTSTQVADVESRPRDRRFNAQWTIALFGTAVGAGILFLPINAGSFGFWPLLVATLLIIPLTYYPQRAFERLIGATPQRGANVLQVLTEYFGARSGMVVALIYWFTIFPVIMIYGVSMVNTVDSFIVNQLHGPQLSRWVLAPLLVGAMVLAVAFGERIMLAAAQVMVYPLIIALLGVSLYLVPQWDLASFMQTGDTSPSGIFQSILLILPVLVFSLSFVGVLSQFSLGMERHYGENQEREASRVILWATLTLFLFTLFFVWSCSLALGADGMRAANEANIPVLSYFANVTDTPVMSFIAPIVAICAIASSFFGLALGALEGTQYLANAAYRGRWTASNPRTFLFIFISVTLVAIYNPSILDLISLVGGIFFALLMFLLPMVAIHRIEDLAAYRHRPSNYFVTAIGLVVIGVTIWGVF